jgi:hypothetical protein
LKNGALEQLILTKIQTANLTNTIDSAIKNRSSLSAERLKWRKRQWDQCW